MKSFSAVKTIWSTDSGNQEKHQMALWKKACVMAYTEWCHLYKILEHTIEWNQWFSEDDTWDTEFGEERGKNCYKDEQDTACLLCNTLATSWPHDLSVLPPRGRSSPCTKGFILSFPTGPLKYHLARRLPHTAWWNISVLHLPVPSASDLIFLLCTYTSRLVFVHFYFSPSDQQALRLGLCFVGCISSF